MLKKITQDKPLLFLWLSFFIFALVNSICILPGGDDFIWAVTTDMNKIIGTGAENGRYFTNILTYFMERIPIVRVIIMTFFTVSLPIVMCRLVWKPEKKFLVSFASMFVIMTIPTEISKYTIFWIAGFTNYVISAVFSLAYICFCLPLFKGEYAPIKKRWAVVTAILGFLGALCVENVTIFNILLAVFIVVFSLVKYKKVNIVHIVYLISTAVATVLMALSSAYSSIIEDDTDEFGFRFTEFGIPDMMMKIYQELLPLFARRFFIFHIIIAISILIMYNKKFGNTKKSPKYAKLFMPIIFMYAAYSLFSRNMSPITALTPAYRIFAVEAAFTFLYLVGLIYMFYSIGDTSDFIRRTIFVVGTIIMTAPFAVVNPVTSRCFFMTCIFWCLITADCAVSAIDLSEIKDSGYVKAAGAVFVGFICITFSCMAISNKHIDNVRLDYIKEQMEKGKKSIYLIKLPYTGIYIDGIQGLLDYNDEDDPMGNVELNMYSYCEDMCVYYDIDNSLLDKDQIWIEAMDYYD